MARPTKQQKKPPEDVFWKCNSCNWSGSISEMSEVGGAKACPTCSTQGDFKKIKSKLNKQQTFLFGGRA